MKKLLFLLTVILFMFGCDTKYDLHTNNETPIEHKYIELVQADTTCSQVAISGKRVYFQNKGLYGEAFITGGTDYMQIPPDTFWIMILAAFAFGCVITMIGSD